MSKQVETRFDEERYTTSDPHEMINRYIARRVLKTWIEDFVDDNTGEVCSIERNEVLFEKGRLIDQDTLVEIQFYMSAGDITEVEVSNQLRMASHHKGTYLHPYIATAEISGNKAKKVKFLFYATCVENAVTLLKDYIELNYSNGFWLNMVQRFSSCIVLVDTLKKAKPNVPFELWDTVTPDENESDEKTQDKKYYQIDARIFYDEDSMVETFIIHSFNVERCMMLIDKYLNDEQDKREQKAVEQGNEYKRMEIRTMIEEARTISIGCFIPKEFSEAYRDQEVDAKNL